MKNIPIKYITESAIIIALYVALTWIFYPLSFQAVQFRISEILILLVLYKRKYAIPLILGCFIANITSSLGAWDMLFGTLATAIAFIPMLFVKNIYISASFPVISNMFIVPLELGIALGSEMFAPGIFWFNVLTVALGEAVVLYLLGIPFMLTINENKGLMRTLNFDSNIVKTNFKFFNAYTLSCMFWGTIYIICYFVFPINKALNGTETTYISAFDMTKNGLYYLIIFPVLAFLYIIKSFFIKNEKLSIVVSGILLLGIASILIVVASNNVEILTNGYYYLFYLLLLFGMLPELNRIILKHRYIKKEE